MIAAVCPTRCEHDSRTREVFYAACQLQGPYASKRVIYVALARHEDGFSEMLCIFAVEDGYSSLRDLASSSPLFQVSNRLPKPVPKVRLGTRLNPELRPIADLPSRTKVPSANQQSSRRGHIVPTSLNLPNLLIVLYFLTHFTRAS